jgi:CubicO group peptidase (beta-lactamase class C family)
MGIPYPTATEHELESGGAGLYSTLDDYSKFLTAVLREDERILDKDMREVLFTPQLNDVQRESLQKTLGETHDTYALDLPRGMKMDFSFGGMVNLEDVPGRRKKGAVMWSGMAGSQWVSLFFQTIWRISEERHADDVTVDGSREWDRWYLRHYDLEGPA